MCLCMLGICVPSTDGIDTASINEDWPFPVRTGEVSPLTWRPTLEKFSQRCSNLGPLVVFFYTKMPVSPTNTPQCKHCFSRAFKQLIGSYILT